MNYKVSSGTFILYSLTHLFPNLKHLWGCKYFNEDNVTRTANGWLEEQQETF